MHICINYMFMKKISPALFRLARDRKGGRADLLHAASSVQSGVLYSWCNTLGLWYVLVRFAMF